MKHATNDYTTTPRTICQHFMDNDDYDYVIFEVSKPYPNESDPLLNRIEVTATLLGKKGAYHNGELSFDKSAFNQLPDTNAVFLCVETVYKVLGFDEPTPGFQICANTVDGVISTMRWAIIKEDRELTQSQIQDITDYLDAGGEPNLVTLDYGIHHINLNQRLNARLVDDRSTLH